MYSWAYDPRMTIYLHSVNNLVNCLIINVIIIIIIIFKNNNKKEYPMSTRFLKWTFITGFLIQEMSTIWPAIAAHPAVQNVSFLDCSDTDYGLAEHENTL